MLRVFIFSFQRGRYLQRLLNGLAEFFPSVPVHVLDDGSQDDHTKSVLRGHKGPVTDSSKLPRLSAQPSRVGSLYEGMNFALHELCDPDDFALLIQDDLQIVRPVGESELRAMCQELTRLRTPFGSVVFQKVQRPLVRVDSAIFPHAPEDGIVGEGYADLSLVDVRKVREAAFYVETEKQASARALDTWGKRVLAKNPFLAFTPWPESYRYRKRAFSQAVWEVVSGYSRIRGLNSWTPIRGEELIRFLSRPAEELPIATRYLNLEQPISRGAISYGGTPSLSPKPVRRAIEIELRIRHKLHSWLLKLRS